MMSVHTEARECGGKARTAVSFFPANQETFELFRPLMTAVNKNDDNPRHYYESGSFIVEGVEIIVYGPRQKKEEPDEGPVAF